MRELLREKGFPHEIILHDEIFKDTQTPDLIWAEWAAKNDYIAFTNDLFKNEQEKRVLSQYQGLVIILPSMPAYLTCQTIIHAWPKINHLILHGKRGCYRPNNRGVLSPRWR